MDRSKVFRIVGGALVLLTGLLVGLGGVALRSGGARNWPDLVATDAQLADVSIGVLIMSVLLLVGAAAALVGASWGFMSAAAAMTLFVAGAFWANHLLFDDVRPLHMGTNVAVAAAAIALLRLGYGTPESGGAARD